MRATRALFKGGKGVGRRIGGLPGRKPDLPPTLPLKTLRKEWKPLFQGMVARQNVVSVPVEVPPIEPPYKGAAPPIVSSTSQPSLTRHPSTWDILVRLEPGEKSPQVAISDVWLRDCCQCSECVNPDTRQRQTNLKDMRLDARVTHVMRVDERDKITVMWNDWHQSTWDVDFFRDLFHPPRKLNTPFPELVTFGADGPNPPPHVSYSDVMSSDEHFAHMAYLLSRDGLVFVHDTPTSSPSATRQLLEHIGPIRTTHYGGFYDFTADLAMADTAYTNIALGPHTDTTYFSDPAGLQAFHVLSHTPDASSSPDQPLGGASLLVDGLAAAQALKTAHPDAYHLLRSVRVPWHASGNVGISIAPDRLYPVIEEAEDGSIVRIRWNNDDRGALPPALSPAEQVAWFRAAQLWAQTLEDLQYWVQLEPGTTLIFDNWRVLHGRSEFTGKRRVCGGYISRDDWVSRWRMTNLGPDEARRLTMGQ